MFRKILVAFDGSSHSKKALRVAAEIAKSFGAEMHLTYTSERERVPAHTLVMEKNSENQWFSEIDDVSAEVVAEAAALAVDAGVSFTGVHIGCGNPADHTLSDARRINADLIVTGRRGLGARGALALGSVSQEVAHGAKCACLTVV